MCNPPLATTSDVEKLFALIYYCTKCENQANHLEEIICTGNPEEIEQFLSAELVYMCMLKLKSLPSVRLQFCLWALSCCLRQGRDRLHTSLSYTWCGSRCRRIAAVLHTRMSRAFESAAVTHNIAYHPRDPYSTYASIHAELQQSCRAATFHCLEISKNRYNRSKTGQVSHLDAIVNIAFVFHNVLIGAVRH